MVLLGLEVRVHRLLYARLHLLEVRGLRGVLRESELVEIKEVGFFALEHRLVLIVATVLELRLDATLPAEAQARWLDCNNWLLILMGLKLDLSVLLLPLAL